MVARAGLGTLNHTALTVQAIQARGLEVAGVVVGSWPEHPDLAEEQNLLDLPRVTGVPLLGRVPEGAAALPVRAFRRGALDWVPRRLANRCRGCGSAATTPTSSTAASAVSTDEGPAVKASTGIRGTWHVRRQVDHPLRQPQQLAELTEGQEQHEERPAEDGPAAPEGVRRDGERGHQPDGRGLGDRGADEPADRQASRPRSRSRAPPRPR